MMLRSLSNDTALNSHLVWVRIVWHHMTQDIYFYPYVWPPTNSYIDRHSTLPRHVFCFDDVDILNTDHWRRLRCGWHVLIIAKGLFVNVVKRWRLRKVMKSWPPSFFKTCSLWAWFIFYYWPKDLKDSRLPLFAFIWLSLFAFSQWLALTCRFHIRLETELRSTQKTSSQVNVVERPGCLLLSHMTHGLSKDPITAYIPWPRFTECLVITGDLDYKVLRCHTWCDQFVASIMINLNLDESGFCEARRRAQGSAGSHWRSSRCEKKNEKSKKKTWNWKKNLWGTGKGNRHDNKL